MDKRLILGICASLAASAIGAANMTAKNPDELLSHAAQAQIAPGSAPLDEALARLIPANYSVVIDESIPGSAILAWPSGQGWENVLRRALSPIGLSMGVDAAGGVVTIQHMPSKETGRVLRNGGAQADAQLVESTKATQFPSAQKDSQPAPDITNAVIIERNGSFQIQPSVKMNKNLASIIKHVINNDGMAIILVKKG